jgi:hypothetical protein
VINDPVFGRSHIATITEEVKNLSRFLVLVFLIFLVLKD